MHGFSFNECIATTTTVETTTERRERVRACTFGAHRIVT